MQKTRNWTGIFSSNFVDAFSYFCGFVGEVSLLILDIYSCHDVRLAFLLTKRCLALAHKY